MAETTTFYAQSTAEGGAIDWDVQGSRANAIDNNTSTYCGCTLFKDVGFSSSYLAATSNTCDGTDLGTITKVEIGIFNYMTSTGEYVSTFHIRPVFDGTTQGTLVELTAQYLPGNAGWQYIDITDDGAGPGDGNWTWSDIQDLDIRVYADNPSPSETAGFFVSEFQWKITYESESAGWSNRIMGVDGTTRIMGVDSSSINRVMGV